MAIAPGAQKPVTLHARLAARYHLQLEIVDRELRGERGSVRGRVVRFFRANGKLRVSDEVTFDLPVRPGPGVPVSPDFDSYQNAVSANEFRSARYVEAFLDRERGRCSLAADQYALLKSLPDAPKLRVPNEAEVRREWKHFGYEMPPLEPDPDAIEVMAVVSMRDQDGGQSNAPSFFADWMEEMKPGDSLTFDHQDGSHLFVQGPARGPFLIRFLADDGQVLAETSSVSYANACAVIRQYIRGDEREAIVRALGETTGPATTAAEGLLPLPVAREEFGFRETYTQFAFMRIVRGLKPSSMDDKWLTVFDGPWLYLHRRTGVCIYAVRFEPSPDGASAVESWVNRDATQYRETDPAYDRALLKFIIDALILGRDTPFPLPRLEPEDSSPSSERAGARSWFEALKNRLLAAFGPRR